MLTDREIELIKSTAPILASQGTVLTAHFYKLLLEKNPELSNIFNLSNQASGNQQEALANAVYAFAANVDNLGALLGAVERIAQKHISLGITAQQYALVGASLIQAIHELLNPGDEMLDAWTKGYGVLADVFINREVNIAKEKAEQEGGWEKTRAFNVVAKEQETELVTSFYLAPQDGKKIAAYLPGQYIGVYLGSVADNQQQIRQYSLSGSNKENLYRISVKRDVTKDPARSVSNYLHDHIQVGDTLAISNPCGEFVLQNTDKPAVLISGGVGITPMQGMLETLVAENSARDIHFVHSTQDSNQHSFSKRLQELSSQNKVTSHVFYEMAVEQDKQAHDYHYQGRTDVASIQSNLPINDAEFYLCGPLAMMKSVYNQLRALEIPDENIFYEVFGPTKSLAD